MHVVAHAGAPLQLDLSLRAKPIAAEHRDHQGEQAEPGGPTAQQEAADEHPRQADPPCVHQREKSEHNHAERGEVAEGQLAEGARERNVRELGHDRGARGAGEGHDDDYIHRVAHAL